MNITHPKLKIDSLDNLWFQVSGTICNIACKHCFNNSSPTNRNFGFLTLAECESYLEESVELGVKEYYFTGGEPFANKEMIQIIEKTLEYGPVTVLTNGMLINEEKAKRLAKIESKTIFSLEMRVSLDGFTEEMNDEIRGKGVFKKTMIGVENLYRHGFLPIITVTKTWNDSEDEKVMNGFRDLLISHGYLRPRIKILPSLKIGKEAVRTKGYDKYEYITEEMMNGFDEDQLLCSNSRLVTSKGVYVCPILIESDDAKVGDDLPGSMKPYELKHQACYTCYLYGAICSNFSTSAREEL
ncbi:MAG: radical SAM protein [Melioribacteraceae bacterium]|nr:radical SAM protein [Melioribacteraceae bacterium]